MSTSSHLADLRREIASLKDQLAKRPLKAKGGSSAAPTIRLVIVQGNTLATGQDGILFSSSTISDVSTAYDPETPGTSTDDGIGWAELFSDGSSQGYVLACNDGSNGSTIDFDLVGGSDPDKCKVTAGGGTKTVTVGGDPNTTLTVYIVDTLT